METHQLWRSSRHNCHLSTADDVHPKTFMLPQAKALVIPPLEVDSSLELYGTLTYTQIISNMKTYNNIISALETKMLVISWHMLCIMLHNSVRISSMDTYDLSCPSTLRCLWVSSVFASARDPRCTRRRSWRHSWHVGDHPREGVETLQEHVRTMSMIKVARAGQNSLPWGFKASMFLPWALTFVFFCFYVSTIIAYCFLLKSDRRTPEKQPQLSMSEPSLVTQNLPHRAWKPGRKLIRRPCCRSTGKPAPGETGLLRTFRFKTTRYKNRNQKTENMIEINRTW